jgi:hypothetical protein
MLDPGNQQATANWVAGILEGEGHFEKRAYGRYKDFCQVHINNCDVDIIQACEKFLQESGIQYRRHSSSPVKGRKTPYRITISGERCRKFYELMLPFIECRRQQFQRVVGASETACETSPDVQWLVGIWQAEGTIYIARNHLGSFIPYLSLENTNQAIVDKTAKSLQRIECTFYKKDFTPTKINWKPYTRIQISGMKRVHRFVSATNGLWVGQRDAKRSALMLEYTTSRLSRSPRSPYSDREMQIYHELKALNV